MQKPKLSRYIIASVVLGLVCNVLIYSFTTRYTSYSTLAEESICGKGSTKYAYISAGFPFKSHKEIAHHTFVGCEEWLYKTNWQTGIQFNLISWQFYVNWIVIAALLLCLIVIMFSF